jgi:hypothetical protein
MQLRGNPVVPYTCRKVRRKEGRQQGSIDSRNRRSGRKPGGGGRRGA